MAKITTDEKVRIILKAILMSKDYQNCYKKYIETKHKAHHKNDMSNHLAWWEIASRWGILEPIDPSVDAKRIPTATLSKVKFSWGFGTGVVSMRWDEHKQLAGQEKVSPTIEVTLDLTQGKTKILKEVGRLVDRLQARRKVNSKTDPKEAIKEQDEKFNCCLEDFTLYEKYLKAKGEGKKITFHQMARKKLGKSEISVDVDLEAKKMRNAYNRAKWLIDGGYEVLKKKI